MTNSATTFLLLAGLQMTSVTGIAGIVEGRITLAAPRSLADRPVIFLSGGGLSGAAPRHVVVEERNGRLTPEFVVLSVGSSLSLGAEHQAVKFEKPGVVQVYSRHQPGMSVTVLVTPNHWFAVADRDGAFVLPYTPQGTYDVIVWHKATGFLKQTIEVAAAGIVDASLEIPVQDAPH